MFCPNCGAEIQDGSRFCPKCGAQLNNVKEQQSHVTPDSVRMNQKSTQAQAEQVNGGSEGTSVRKNTSRIIAIIVAAVVIIAVIVIIIVSNSRPAIDMNKYLTVYESGYNGYGSVDYDIDYMQLYEDYGGKLKLTSEGNNNYVMGSAVARGEDPVELIYDDISIHPDVSSNLSNGDKVTFTWDTSEINMLETYIKVSIKTENYIYTVSDLPETTKEDLFAGVSMEYSGIAPNGNATVTVDDTANKWLSPSDFIISSPSNLSNDDTITLSISDSALDTLLHSYGIEPLEKEKKFTVEGLFEHITSLDEIPSDVFEEMQSTATDYIERAFNVDEWGAKVNGYEYLGSYLTYGDNSNNDIYLTYRIDMTITYNDETEDVDNYWYCCFQNSAINAGGEFGAINEDGEFSIGDFDYKTPSYTANALTGSPIGEGFRIKVGGKGINIAGFQTLQELKDQINADSAIDSSVVDSLTET